MTAILDDAQKRLLVELYEQGRRSRDDLPYTDEFEQLYAEFLARTGLPLTRHELWRALGGLGKASKLTHKGR